MNMKKIVAIAAAAIMAAGVCTGLPTGTENTPALAITAEAEDSDFFIYIGEDGKKCLEAYTGEGGDVKIPNDIARISSRAFYGNDSITSITLPKSCTYIGSKAFAYCYSLNKVVIEGDVGIGEYAFDYCVNLKSVTVKGSVSDIKRCAFDACQSLKTVKIKKDECEFAIGESAFQNCFALTSINIPSKCTEIYDAFINCFSLTELTIPAKTKINTKYSHYNFGYAHIFESASEAEKFASGKEYTLGDAFVADGKTKGYDISYSYKNGVFKGKAKQFTPKAITLTVTKGSPAEKWAKENGVKYVYAKSSSSKKKAASSK